MKLSKYIILTLSVILLLAISPKDATAQFGKDFKEQEKQHMAKRIFVGGGLGFWFYSVDGYLWLSPVVGYHISPSFDVGTRFTYSYYWYNDNLYKFNLNSYGAGVFGRYYLFFFRDLFFHVEYEYLSVEQPLYPLLPDNIQTERFPVNNWYLGAGYRQWLSPSAYLGITVLFNINEQLDYMAQNPLIRIGFGVGL